jgi:hypothetical protein
MRQRRVNDYLRNNQWERSACRAGNTGPRTTTETKRLKLAKLRSANGARIILGSVLGLLLITT